MQHILKFRLFGHGCKNIKHSFKSVAQQAMNIMDVDSTRLDLEILGYC